MSRRRKPATRLSGGFSAIPFDVQDSPNFIALSGSALKVLLALARQFNGFNNGDLCASFSVMRARGIRSQDTLYRAIAELRHRGMIELTRQGGLHASSLYALTWLPIHECKRKLDVSPTLRASGAWKLTSGPPPRRSKNQNATTDSVADRYGFRSTAATDSVAQPSP